MTGKSVGLWLVAAIAIVGLLVAVPAINAHGNGTQADNETTSNWTDRAISDEGAVWMAEHMRAHIGPNASAWMAAHMGLNESEWVEAYGPNESAWVQAHIDLNETAWVQAQGELNESAWMRAHIGLNGSVWTAGENGSIAPHHHAPADDAADNHDEDDHRDDGRRGHGGMHGGGHGC